MPAPVLVLTEILKRVTLNKMPKLRYFEKEDVLHLALSDEPEDSIIELSPNITVECNDKGELIGVEMLRASEIIAEITAGVS